MDTQEPVLNIYSGQRKPENAAVKLNRGERMRKKRKTLVSEFSSGIVSEHDLMKKPKIDGDKKSNEKSGVNILPKIKEFNNKANDGPATRLPNFSSLFTSNPVIPDVKSTKCKSFKENVFSGTNFSDLPIHKYIVQCLDNKMEIKEMTAVQRNGIPHLLQGKDVMLKSQTGSGKTLAYVVPMVHDLQTITPKIKRLDGPYAIIVLPTRELALQSMETLTTLLGSFNHIVPGFIMGGENRKSEKARLRKGINVLVCTPGRLLDHLKNTQSLVLDHVKWLIIDEADRMLELGFEKSVGEIVSSLKTVAEHHQTVLLSATLTSKVQHLAGITLKNYETVDITKDALPKKSVASSNQDRLTSEPNQETNGHGGEDGGEGGRGGEGGEEEDVERVSLPTSLKHTFVVVPHKLRLVTLGAFLISKTSQKHKLSKIIVFMATQQSVDFHFSLLQAVLYTTKVSDEIDAMLTRNKKEVTEEVELDTLQLMRTANSPLFKLHGAMPQKERTKVFQEFSSKDSGVLLCTDVAARGLDIPNVDWIVQYNTPGSTTDYIHRVGRTARIGCPGNAVLFLAPSETGYVQTLVDENIKITELPMNDILKTLIYYEAIKVAYGRQVRTIEEAATFLQKEFELGVHNGKDLRTRARNAYQSFVRAYASYPSSLKSIFHIKNLHLGHVAKSFGLSDAPQQIGAIAGKFAKMDSRNNKKKLNRKLELTFEGDEQKTPLKMKKKKTSQMSEFGSGFGDSSTKNKKRKTKKNK